MKRNRRLVTGLALALAGTMLWANLSWAQGGWGGGGRGRGCQWNQTSQNTWQRQGQGNLNCPNYPGVHNRGQGRGMNAPGQGQGSGRARGRGMNYQATNPNTTQ